VIDLVRREAATAPEGDGGPAIAADAPFTELGPGSSTTVELRNRLAAVTGGRRFAADPGDAADEELFALTGELG